MSTLAILLVKVEGWIMLIGWLISIAWGFVWWKGSGGATPSLALLILVCMWLAKAICTAAWCIMFSWYGDTNGMAGSGSGGYGACGDGSNPVGFSSIKALLNNYWNV